MSARRTRGPERSDPESREFAQLLMGHANQELTALEEERMRELEQRYPARAEQISHLEQVHSLFEQERDLALEMSAPLEPREEADEGFGRLQSRAAEAERSLRARLLHPVSAPGAVTGRGWASSTWIGSAWTRRLGTRRLGVLLPLAAALILGLVLIRGGGGPPALLPEAPGPERMGAAMPILLTAEIDADNRTVSWLSVPGAGTYTVVVEDDAGNLVLERGDAEARSNRWELTEAQFQLLRQREGPLLLRVEAQDGAGNVVGTTGDLPLTIRRNPERD